MTWLEEGLLVVALWAGIFAALDWWWYLTKSRPL